MLKIDVYSVDCRSTEPLHVTAVRYRPSTVLPPGGVTLILTHALGLHKETWTPLIRYLFSLAESTSKPIIQEAWSIECPNHGESIVINDSSLKQNYPKFPWDGMIYPRVMHIFLHSRPDGVDFKQQKLVLAGHSWGSQALMLLDSMQHSFTVIGHILVDALVGEPSSTLNHMKRAALQISWNRRDAWPSREVAKRDLGKLPGYRNWNAEVLDLFVKHGLRDHYAAKLPVPYCFPDFVTLSCSRMIEAACNCEHDYFLKGFEHLQRLYREGQVHIIHSRRDEFDSDEFKRSQIAPEPLSGRGPKSVQIIEKGGHMFVQTMPEVIARAMHAALCSIEYANSRKPTVAQRQGHRYAGKL